MYIPIMWANPYDLDLIKEKRKRKGLNSTQVKKTEKEQNKSTTKAFEMLFRSLALGRMF